MAATKSTKGRATIVEVAAMAGVSISTVSRALSGHPGVGDQTRARVIDVAGKIGYQRNGAARSLRTARSMTLAMLAPDLENPDHLTQMRTVVNTAATHGYAVMVFDVSAGPIRGASVINRIRQGGVDGVILGAGRLEVTRELLDLLDSPMLVEFGGELADSFSEGTFVDDRAPWLPYERAACTHAGRRLFATGHEQVAYIGWRERSLLGRSRFQAFQECAIAQGLPETAITLATAAQRQEAVGLVQQLLASTPRPTALISGASILTPYVLEGVHSAGATIPEDLSFVAFGDSPWHRAFHPSLSVIRRNLEAEAGGMVERLIARIEGSEVPGFEVQPTEFIDRGSIAPPRTGTQ